MANYYKAYLDNQSNSHLLGALSTVGQWYYDQEDVRTPDEVTKEDWLNTITETTNFLKLAEKWFGELRYTIEIYGSNNRERNPMIFYRAENIEEISQIVFEYMEENVEDFNFWSGFYVKCAGKCVLTETTYLYSASLFDFWITRTHLVSLSIRTQNLCFVAYNSITRTKQFEMWKNNAPKLAKLLHEFTCSSKMKLLTEAGEMETCGAISGENIYYLVGTPFSSPEGESWEEWVVPFELLNEEDYIFGQIGNEGR
jgi:hypothetical protein